MAKRHRNLGIVCLVFFVLVGVASAYGLWAAAPQERRIVALYAAVWCCRRWLCGIQDLEPADACCCAADEEGHELFRSQVEETENLREDARNLMLFEQAREWLMGDDDVDE